MSHQNNFLTARNKARKGGKKIATFDIESNNWTDFEMLGFFDGEDYFQFNTVKEFLDFVLVKKYRAFKIYGHYAGKFDTLFLFDDLFKDKFQVDILTQGSKITQLKVSRHEHNWYFVDSSALFPNLSLEKLTKAFKVEHQKLSGTIDFAGGEQVKKENLEHQKYLEYDCKGLYEVIEKFKSDPAISREGLHLTLASQAMGCFRHTLTHSIKTNSQHVQDFTRQSYVGGRVEIFKMQGDNLNYYDANSLYPTAMLKPMPTQWKKETREITEALGFFDVTIKAPDCYLPILPYKYEKKLIFPVGEFRGVYFSEELKLALKNGYQILKLHEGHEFHESNTLFKGYVEYFYNKKKNAAKGSAEELIAKLLLNSCYGKFGQREERTQIKTWEGEKQFEALKDPEFFEKTGLIKIIKDSRSAYMLPHIASAVTSWARIYMLEKCLLKNPENCFYTDTDSILTPDIFPTGSELGELKLESHNGILMEGVSGTFLLPKAYLIEKNGEKIMAKVKGFSKKTIDALSIEDFKARKISESKEVLHSFKRSIISNRCFKSKGFVNKEFNAIYSKRRQINKIETIPHLIKNGVISPC